MELFDMDKIRKDLKDIVKKIDEERILDEQELADVLEDLLDKLSDEDSIMED